MGISINRDINNKMGNLLGLTTQNKTDLVSAINENVAFLNENVNIKGTIQSIVYNSDGTIQKMQHKDINSNLIREDVFTYADNLITEVRTLSDGNSITLKYHLDTLGTEVI